MRAHHSQITLYRRKTHRPGALFAEKADATDSRGEWHSVARRFRPRMHDSLTARLDRSDRQRKVAASCRVIGREFSHEFAYGFADTRGRIAIALAKLPTRS